MAARERHVLFALVRTAQLACIIAIVCVCVWEVPHYATFIAEHSYMSAFFRCRIDWSHQSHSRLLFGRKHHAVQDAKALHLAKEARGTHPTT